MMTAQTNLPAIPEETWLRGAINEVAATLGLATDGIVGGEHVAAIPLATVTRSTVLGITYVLLRGIVDGKDRWIEYGFTDRDIANAGGYLAGIDIRPMAEVLLSAMRALGATAIVFDPPDVTVTDTRQLLG